MKYKAYTPILNAYYTDPKLSTMLREYRVTKKDLENDAVWAIYE